MSLWKCFNEPKSLLGIETLDFAIAACCSFGFNEPKSLLGIETGSAFERKHLWTSFNEPKSLLGIETNYELLNLKPGLVSMNLNPY